MKGLALHFDCFAGIAGDMALGAFLDLGVPEDVILGELGKLPMHEWKLTHERVKRGALMGTKIHVQVGGHVHVHGHVHDHDHDHRHYREIRGMLQGLDGEVKGRAIAIFDRIAAVEARLHGVSVEDVAFHEVGAIDSIVDIVGAAAALAWLEPSRITARRVPLGGGTVKTAHGVLPVPAPATLELLKGAEVEAGGDHELTTPTGAAILAASVSAYCELPPMTIAGVGWGAGDRHLHDRPNLLRVVVGQPAERVVVQESLSVIEANLDDMNPELSEPLMEALFAAGALDVWFAPIVMKKGRPALLVGALCEQAKRDQVVRACLRESSTIGVRHYAVERSVLARRFVEVETPFGKIPIKVAGEGAEVWNAAPEYEACRRAAAEHGVPVKQVYAAALSAFFPSYNRPR
jgi:hypothetical protein